VQLVAEINSYQSFYIIIKKIPKGKVATYGQIAMLAGMPGQARRVGYALYNLSDAKAVPWYRVINASGQISRLPDPEWMNIQRTLLEAEGVVFDSRDRIDLNLFQWRPRSRKRQRL
jgi:methylated-DNA-protein-cysteine methyltransferase related protein